MPLHIRLLLTLAVVAVTSAQTGRRLNNNQPNTVTGNILAPRRPWFGEYDDGGIFGEPFPYRRLEGNDANLIHR